MDYYKQCCNNRKIAKHLQESDSVESGNYYQLEFKLCNSAAN